MKVTINHTKETRKTGWLSSFEFPCVVVDVQFSEEELHLIRSNNIEKQEIATVTIPWKLTPQGGVGPAKGPQPRKSVRVGDLMSGPNTYERADVELAQEFEDTIMGALRDLKEQLNRLTAPSSRTVEL